MTDDTAGPPWITSTEAGTVLGAFANALGELDDVHRASTAVIETKSGGSYRYSYADLAAVLATIRPVMAGQGLGITQHVSTLDGAVQVTTTVVHTGGEWISFDPLTLRVAGSDPQSIGSAITYARRYGLLALCGLATEDDDGAAASRTPPRRNPPPVDWEALGWTAQAEHDTERERVRTALGAVADDVRAVLLAQWEQMGLAWPLSRDQLAQWDEAAAAIIAQETAEQPAPEPATATGPRMTATAKLVAQVRAAGAAIDLDDADTLTFLSASMGTELASFEALTAAQAKAAIEMLGAVTPEPGPGDDE